MSERMFFSICQSQYRCDATWYPTQSNFSPVAFIFFLFFLFFVCVFCVLLRPVFAIGNAALRKNNSPGQREMVNAAHFILLCKTNDCKYCLAKMHGAEVAIQKQSQPSDFIFLFYVWMVVPARLFVTRIRIQNQICRMKISVNRMSAVSSPSLDCCLYLWPFVHCQRPPIDVDFCGWYAQSTFTQADSLSWKRTFVDMVICLIYCVIGIRRGKCWPNKADHSFVDVCVRRTSTYTQRAISAISRNEKQCY